jgi:hypothetical protein
VKGLLVGFQKRLLGALAFLAGMVLVGYSAYLLLACLFLYPWILPKARWFDPRPFVEASQMFFGTLNPWAGWALILGAMVVGLALVTLGHMAFGVKEKRADLYPIVPGESTSTARGQSHAGIQTDPRHITGQPQERPEGITERPGGGEQG